MTKKLKKMSRKLGFSQYRSKGSHRGIIPLGTAKETQHKVFCQYCGRSVLRARYFMTTVWIKGVPFRCLCKHCERLID